MDRNEHFFRMNQQNPSRYGYGGGAPRTDLRMYMCCTKCEEKAQEEIGEVYGVQDVFTDQAQSMVTVYGLADTHAILKKARKVDKRAELASSESFSTHHGRHGRSKLHSLFSSHHHRNHGSHYNHNHHYQGTGNFFPLESRRPHEHRDYHRSGGYNGEYMGGTGYNRPESRYRQNAYQRSQTYPDYHVEYRRSPIYPEYRSSYNDYRPSQSYPSRADREFYDTYSESYDINPSYMKHIEYY